MPHELSPFELDRELSRVAPRARAAYRALRSGREVTLHVPEVLSDPETIERVASDTSDPIAASLVRWLYWLTLMRRSLALEGARVRRYRAARMPLDAPLSGQFSWRELLGHALRDPKRREPLLEVMIERGSELRDALSRQHELRAQLTHFAGRSRAELELPHPDMTTLAERMLRDSADARSNLPLRTLGDVLELGLAHAADDGWPRQLSLRSLHELLGDSSWLSGLKLDPGELPVALSPASFTRGLLRLGAAWTDALASQSRPFALSRDPFGLARSTHGALFAGLTCSPVFLKRQLGLGSARALEHARALTKSALLYSRQLALRVLLDAPALAGPGALREAFAEQAASALGFELPPEAAGLFFRPRLGDAQKLCGLLLASARANDLAEEYDDDWFRNPRAIERLRAEADMPVATRADPSELERGAALLRSSLARAH